MTFDSPEALRAFVAETEQALRNLGLEQAAASLHEVQAAAYTTSSEWLGQLGAAVRGIRQQFRRSSDIRQRLDRIMAAARRAWPGS